MTHVIKIPQGVPRINHSKEDSLAVRVTGASTYVLLHFGKEIPENIKDMQVTGKRKDKKTFMHLTKMLNKNVLELFLTMVNLWPIRFAILYAKKNLKI